MIDTTSDNSLIYNEFSAYVTDLEFTADGSRLFYTQGDYRFVHVSDFSTGQTPVAVVSTPDGGWAIPLAVATSPDRHAGPMSWSTASSGTTRARSTSR